MFGAAGVLLAATATVAPPSQIFSEVVPHSEMIIRLQGCGFSDVEIAFEPELQSDMILIGDEAVSETQVDCLANAAWRTSYILDPSLPYWSRYWELVGELMWPYLEAQFRSYFQSRPELGTPPLRKENENDRALAERIESFCGPSADGAFTFEYGTVSLAPRWLEGLIPPKPRRKQAWECLSNAAGLAKLKFGFIGNEKAPASSSENIE